MDFYEFSKWFNKKHPDPSKRGFEFEPYAKWFLENHPYYLPCSKIIIS